MGLLARELGAEADLARLIDPNSTVKMKLMRAALLFKEFSTLKSYFCHFLSRNLCSDLLFRSVNIL